MAKSVRGKGRKGAGVDILLRVREVDGEYWLVDAKTKKLLPGRMVPQDATMVTDWYPWQTKPVRVGVYERDYRSIGYGINYFSLWDGDHWYSGYAYNTRRFCVEHVGQPSRDTTLSWRGLTTEGGLLDIMRAIVNVPARIENVVTPWDSAFNAVIGRLF